MTARERLDGLQRSLREAGGAAQASESVMAHTNKGIDQGLGVETSRMIINKELPEETYLSGGERSWPRPRWLMWLGVTVFVLVGLYYSAWTLGVTVAVLAALYWGVTTFVDRVGGEFFSKGRDAVMILHTMARGLRAQDLTVLERLYAPDFRGYLLGLTDIQFMDCRDDVRLYAFRSKGELADRQAALTEWQSYLAGFASVDEVRLHLDHMDTWRGTDEVVASVRFELIGVPNEESEAGIDRAYLRMHFDASQKPCTILKAELISGDRTINSRPRRWGWYPIGVEPPRVPAFTVLPRRWVVERTIAWIGRYRRLRKDYADLLESCETRTTWR